MNNKTFLRKKIDQLIAEVKEFAEDSNTDLGIVILSSEENGGVSGAICGDEKHVLAAVAGFMMDEHGLSLIERANKVCMVNEIVSQFKSEKQED